MTPEDPFRWIEEARSLKAVPAAQSFTQRDLHLLISTRPRTFEKLMHLISHFISARASSRWRGRNAWWREDAVQQVILALLEPRPAGGATLLKYEHDTVGRFRGFVSSFAHYRLLEFNRQDPRRTHDPPDLGMLRGCCGPARRSGPCMCEVRRAHWTIESGRRHVSRLSPRTTWDLRVIMHSPTRAAAARRMGVTPRTVLNRRNRLLDVLCRLPDDAQWQTMLFAYDAGLPPADAPRPR